MAVYSRSWKTVQFVCMQHFVRCEIITRQFDDNRQVKFAMKVHDRHCCVSHSLLFVAEQLQVHSMSVM